MPVALMLLLSGCFVDASNYLDDVDQDGVPAAEDCDDDDPTVGYLSEDLGG